jgi:hypothetical protein
MSRRIKVTRATAPPKIDGVMAADEWKHALKAELTFQVYPAGDDASEWELQSPLPREPKPCYSMNPPVVLTPKPQTNSPNCCGN